MSYGRRVSGLSFFSGISGLVLLCGSELAMGQFALPPGYQQVALVDSSNQPLSPEGLAVSSSGELAVANGSSVTLYNTWQNGRTVVGTASDAQWSSEGDPVFLNNSTILFGENGNTDALWEVNFATPTPTVTQITADNSLPAVQGVALISPTTALVSGTTASLGNGGGLYLDTVDLTQTSDNVTPLQTNVGSGYVGNSGVSPGGADLLLEDSISGPSLVHLYDGPNSSSISLAGGNGYGAYGIAFDSSGVAYVTTGDTITEIAGIDSASPQVSEFALDENPNFPFLTSISFTGGGFDPAGPSDLNTGALIVNDGDGQAYAIFVPEPASVGLLTAMCVMGMVRRRGRGR